MEKKSNKDNSLIKRKNLVLMMKKEGIMNISKDSLDLLEGEIERYLESLVVLMKEEMLINGRRTLKKEDVRVVLDDRNKKEDVWEV